MADIVLTTFNARYSHTAFGLRSLMANLGDLRGRARLIEFDIHLEPAAAAEKILAESPRIVGLGVYIWNVAASHGLVELLKQARPELTVVLGGPEVSCETAGLPIAQRADYIVTGEGELAFASLCRELLAGKRPPEKIVPGGRPDLEQLALPYDLYSEDDIGHRTLYAETSRGCPFRCEYCLSSLDPVVRRFQLEHVLPQLGRLMDRGAKRFKFVDRTFNLDMDRCREILAFFRERHAPGMEIHFEMVPDRFPEELRRAIIEFPPGALRFEVGIQTFNEEVAARVGRKTDYARVDDNLRFLRDEAGAIVHADLIAGLPGESLGSFGAGFNRLLALRPQEIQVGILKRLRGTAIGRHADAWGLAFNPEPPYEVIETGLVGRADMERIGRFARYWDLVVNSGRFAQAAPLLWEGARSAFDAFMRFSDWLHARLGRAHAIPLPALTEALLAYLTLELHRDPAATAAVLLRDYSAGGRRRDVPGFLRPSPAR